MKTVFSNDMVCHVWAQQSQSLGRSGSIFFEHATLYSYGYHYKIAEYRDTPSGVRVVYFNADGSSKTTERHKTLAHRAIPDGIPIFTLPDAIWDDADACVDWYRQQIKEAYDKARRARTNAPWIMEAAERLEHESDRFSQLHYLCKADAQHFRPADYSDLQARARAQREAYREARKPKTSIEKLRACHAAYVAWRAGRDRACPGPWAHVMKSHRLTYSEADDTIYTSGGASFPGEHARRAALPLLAVLDKGAALNRVNRLGHFQIDSIGDTIRAGCHRVTRREARRLIRRLIGA